MKIAYLNTMGIPARYRGFETCVEELSERLVQKGHDITVYCASRSPSKQSLYKGVNLIYLPWTSNKFVDYPRRSLLSTLDGMSRDFDILHYYGTDSSIFTILPRILSRKKVVMSLDGLPWNRSSYPRWARKALQLTSWPSLYLPHVTTIDSMTAGEWYRNRFGKAPIFVPYGTKVSPRHADPEALHKLGVERDEYFLFVGALVAEKGIHHLVRAFNKLNLNSHFRLIIVGGNPYESAYELSLKKMAGKNVKFLGNVWGSDMENLYKGAYAYVTASELEGTSPALLSAMGFGNCVLVSDIPENLETVGDAGVTFRNKDAEDLREKMLWLLSNPKAVQGYRERAVERVAGLYSWDSIADSIERIYLSLIGN